MDQKIKINMIPSVHVFKAETYKKKDRLYTNKIECKKRKERPSVSGAVSRAACTFRIPREGDKTYAD